VLEEEPSSTTAPLEVRSGMDCGRATTRKRVETLDEKSSKSVSRLAAVHPDQAWDRAVVDDGSHARAGGMDYGKATNLGE
jgi:hypothetical protein